MPAIVITTFERPAALDRLLASISSISPEDWAAGPVVVDQSADPVVVPAPVRLFRAEPGFPGPRRRLAASLIAPSVEALLFLDDDMELLPSWAEDRDRLLELVSTDDIGLVSLPTRRGLPTRPRSPVVGMCGGMLVRSSAYLAVGGHGDDYLDDIELSLRLRWGGWRIVRWHRRVSVHRFGTPGGLRALQGVEPKRDAHLRLSRLAEVYPDRLIQDARSWWGHREVRRG